MPTPDQPAIARHPALQVLRLGLFRDSLLKVIASVALLAVGIVLLLVFFRENVILTVLGLAGVIVGIRLVFAGLRNLRIKNHRLMVLLRDHPAQIVWVYALVTERLPFGFRFARSGILYFKLADGDEITVTLGAGDLRLVSRFLNRLLPHASFGYTRDREQWYLASPELLRKEVEK